MFDKMVKSGYFMFMAEASGKTNLISTRTAKVNAAIKDFKYIVSCGGNPNDYKEAVLAKYGLNEAMLTDAEINKILKAV